MNAIVSVPGVLASFTAGILSFLSPCVLPLIPVYLSFISGESVASLKGGEARRFRLFVRSLCFVAGFTLVFVILAIVAGGGMHFAGSAVRSVLTKVAGIVVILLSLNVIFDFVPLLRREFRSNGHMGTRNAQAPDSKEPGSRIAGSGCVKGLVLGMAFAAGWTPCVGPILSGILLYAGKDGSVAQAAFLLAVYSAGLGLPFIATGFFIDRLTPALRFLTRHGTAVRIASGCLLFALGLAILMGGLSSLASGLMRMGYALDIASKDWPAWLRAPSAALARWFTFQGI